MQKHILIAVGATVCFLLAACTGAAFIDDELLAETATEPTEPPIASATATAEPPTVTLAVTVTATATSEDLPTFTPSPTPYLEVPVPASGTCMPPTDQPLDVPSWNGWQIGMDPQETLIAKYLDAGGDPDALVDQPLPPPHINGRGFTVLPTQLQVVIHDLTGDAIPDVIAAETGEIDLYQDYTDVWMFICMAGQYQSIPWFREASGVGAIGLYEGGGARVVSVADLNHNGIPDLLLSINRMSEIPSAGIGSSYYLMEWDGSAFKSLIRPGPLTGTEPSIYSEVDGSLQIIDLDGDLYYELAIGDEIYRWDGEYYTLQQ